MSAILDHIDGILRFPHAGRARDDVRQGMRTTSFKKWMSRPVSSWSTSSASSMVARTGRPRSAKVGPPRRRADDVLVRGKCVAGESTPAVCRQHPPTRFRRSDRSCRGDAVVAVVLTVSGEVRDGPATGDDDQAARPNFPGEDAGGQCLARRSRHTTQWGRGSTRCTANGDWLPRFGIETAVTTARSLMMRIGGRLSSPQSSAWMAFPV